MVGEGGRYPRCLSKAQLKDESNRAVNNNRRKGMMRHFRAGRVPRLRENRGAMKAVGLENMSKCRWVLEDPRDSTCGNRV